MRRTKRLWTLFLAVMIIAMIPASAFAASKKNIPTAGYKEQLKDGKWVKLNDFSMNYNSQGKIISYSRRFAGGGSEKTTYKWNGDRVIQSTYTSSDKSTNKEKRSFLKKKKNFVKSAVVDNGNDHITLTYKWKKNTATVTEKYDDNSSEPSSYTVKVNNNGRILMESHPREYASGPLVYKYKYYGNGNLKSITNSNGAVMKYNKDGYLAANGIITYKYTMDKKKKAPKLVEWTEYFENEEFKFRIKYTKYKKVSKVRNCDATGYRVILGTFGLDSFRGE